MQRRQINAALALGISMFVACGGRQDTDQNQGESEASGGRSSLGGSSAKATGGANTMASGGKVFEAAGGAEEDGGAAFGGSIGRAGSAGVGAGGTQGKSGAAGAPNGSTRCQVWSDCTDPIYNRCFVPAAVSNCELGPLGYCVATATAHCFLMSPDNFDCLRSPLGELPKCPITQTVVVDTRCISCDLATAGMAGAAGSSGSLGIAGSAGTLEASTT